MESERTDVGEVVGIVGWGTMGTKWSTSGPTKWEGSSRATRQSFALTVVVTFVVRGVDDFVHHV